VVLVALVTPLTSCGGGSDADQVVGTTTTGIVPSERCLVRLHGKGETGQETVQADGVAVVSPIGNADGWGGRQWLYFPEDEYERAIGIVRDAVEECRQIIINGFSNGAAFAGKLYCRGETFGGRLVRVVIDDPVVDGAVLDCSPDPTVEVTLYWTGELDVTAQPGWDCTERDWTCEGGVTIGINAYAAALATEVQQSAHDTHIWYNDAPELSQWA